MGFFFFLVDIVTSHYRKKKMFSSEIAACREVNVTGNGDEGGQARKNQSRDFLITSTGRLFYFLLEKNIGKK